MKNYMDFQKSVDMINNRMTNVIFQKIIEGKSIINQCSH